MVLSVVVFVLFILVLINVYRINELQDRIKLLEDLLTTHIIFEDKRKEKNDKK